MSGPMASGKGEREPPVGWWLICVCVLVFAMVMVGGATRLTDSGLSITEWDLGKGLTPPLSDRALGGGIRALPDARLEYQTQNRGMSPGEFQQHLLVGMGASLSGQDDRPRVRAAVRCSSCSPGACVDASAPVLALFALGGLQGAIGWWMVTSGLFERARCQPAAARDPLGMAFLILALALWLALDAFGWPRERSELGAPRWAPSALMALIFVQVMFGALLAGADGGRAYADWPTIGGRVDCPHAPSAEVVGELTEDHATQHLLHRTLGLPRG